MFVSQIQVLGVLGLHVRRTYHERFAVKEVSRIVHPIGGGAQPWSRSDVFRLQGDVIALLLSH